MRNPKPVKATKKDATKYAKEVSKPIVGEPIQKAIQESTGRNAEALANEFARIARIELGHISNIEKASTILSYFETLSEEHKEKVARAFHAAISIDVRPFLAENPALRNELLSRVDDNVALITNIADEMVTTIAESTKEVFLEKPFDRQAMKKHFHRQLGKTGWKLRRLARDQVSKSTGQFNQLRQQQLGVQKFIWRTSGDGRVRDTHIDNDGKKFFWDDPPAATGIPGNDIMCRCTAEAIIDTDIVRRLGG